MYEFYDGLNGSVPADTVLDNKVVLVVNNERFPCDKLSLQNASPYFQAMFNSSMKESTAGEIDIKDVEAEVFKVLLEYAHSNHLPILSSSENDFGSLFELLKAACVFQFDDVSKHICRYLSNVMDDANCLKFWELADVLALPDLRKKAKIHVLWNGDVILDHAEILETSFETFLEIVSAHNLRVKSELNVVLSVVNWVRENDADQEKSARLYNEIRIGDLSSRELEQIPKHIKAMIIENGSGTPSQKFCNSNKRTRCSPLSPLLYGYSFNGRKNKLNIHFHVQQEKRFKEISSTCLYVKTLTGFGACVVGKDVYIFGGREKVHCGKWNRNMWKYDSLKDKWVVMPEFPYCRRAFRCLVLENCIYVLGGFGENRLAQTSMICFDIETGFWTEKTSPPFCMYTFVVVAGTYHGSSVLFFFSTGVHVYFPKEDEWEAIEESPVVSGILHAVENKGQLYLMTQELAGTVIYLYDPEKPQLTQEAVSLSEDCNHFTVLNGKIFIYTDNGVEEITLPTDDDDECVQIMFKWRNQERKPLNGHLKFVGQVPFYK